MRTIKRANLDIIIRYIRNNNHDYHYSRLVDMNNNPEHFELVKFRGGYWQVDFDIN